MLGKRIRLLRLIWPNRLNLLTRLIYLARRFGRLNVSAEFNDSDNAAASICVINLTNADLSKDVTNDLICKNFLLCQNSVD